LPGFEIAVGRDHDDGNVEQMFSATPPKADPSRTSRHDGFVPQ
jgi:hypothetical protein